MTRPGCSLKQDTAVSWINFRSLPVVLILILVFTSSTGCGSSEGSSEKIVFRSNRTGNYEIYSINPNGTGLQQLTFDDGDDSEPSLAPNGRIVFHSDRDGAVEIYSMDLDGGNVKQVTDNDARDSHPEWSPDGRLIAFQRYVFWGNDEVYVMNSDGSSARNLTNTLLEQELWPSWSPDGSRIFFCRGGDIYVVGVNGSGLSQLTTGTDWDYSPSCSPDGTTITFNRYSQIFLMDLDGSNIRQVVYVFEGSSSDWEPVFSPDGSQIIFVRSESNGSRLMIVNVDGSNARDLTGLQPGFYNTCPDWKRVHILPVVTHFPTAPGNG
ncbi:TolB family protein [Gemmatimonadota bacterium]